MKTLIVYYSLTGNTEYAAKQLAEQVNADLVKLKPDSEPPKQGRMMFVKGGYSALFHSLPKLEPLGLDPQAYDLVIIGSPVWAGTYAPAIGSFLKDNELKEKKIAIFASSSSGSDQRMFKGMENKIGTTGALKLSLIDPLEHQDTEDPKIAEFAEKILQLK